MEKGKPVKITDELAETKKPTKKDIEGARRLARRVPGMIELFEAEPKGERKKKDGKAK